MPADASRLRAAVRDYGQRVVADAASQVAAEAPKDRRTTEARNPPRAVLRRPATGRVAARSGLQARVRFTTYGWRWQSSSSPRPFAPREHHAQLNGHVFTDWDDPRLRNTTQLWIRSAYFHPGDHEGCRCRAPSAPAPADMAVWRPVVTDVWQRAARAAAKRQNL